MQNLLNAKWLFFVNTLPTIILFILAWGQFDIIQSLLDEESIQIWKSLGLTLGVMSVLHLIYALYAVFQKKPVSPAYGIIALVAYTAFLYMYMYYIDEVIPFHIPRWMASDDGFLYFGTFLMPTLAYALFTLVVHSTNLDTSKAWRNFLAAISVPILFYLFYLIILPLSEPFRFSDMYLHAITVLSITATISFLFFLIRAIFILAIQKATAWEKYQWVWKIPIALIFPILGLALNQGWFDKSTVVGYNIFGNFSNSWFYILAVINGILLCLPNATNTIYRLALLVGRSITFTYTLYFFFVFLPFLPLSVFAIIAFGAGFLMLTPLLLFVIHSHELSKDFSYLQQSYSRNVLRAIIFLGVLTIPVVITFSYVHDKKVLNETLDYLYSPDYDASYPIDTISLRNTLNVVEGHRNRNGGSVTMLSNRTPYLSSYYNYIVLDNLTLSRDKVKTIKKVFFGENSPPSRKDHIQNQNVYIQDISSNSTYDEEQQAWKSWIDLEIINENKNNRLAEYATTIELPEGCWISDYYLYVGERREPGILAEKKSAMWVFSQIRNTNRDPGILYYLTGNKVAFRVFPFVEEELRKTGIELLHKDPIQVTIDSHTVQLGTPEKAAAEIVETEHLIYIPAEQKSQLKTVQRQPYFHFLVDVSKAAKTHTADFTQRIEQALEQYPALAENAQISFVNTYTHTQPLAEDWRAVYAAQHCMGGYYLDRAIKTTLYQAYQNQSYPVMVAVTDSWNNAILTKDFADFEFAFPESPLFFQLQKDGNLQAHSLIENPRQALADSIDVSFQKEVLAYPISDDAVAYIAKDSSASILLKKDIFDLNEADITTKNWASALDMQGAWRSQILHPETANQKWLDIVKYSFMSKVMTPLTSYIVVENEAQKAILRQKQKQVLSGNRILDLSEDAQRMSEPNWMILAVLIGLGIWYRKRRKKQLKATKHT